MCLMGLTEVAAQVEVTRQQAWWLRLYTKYEAGNNWVWHFELDERRFILPDRQKQFVSHIHLHRKCSVGSELGTGMTYSVVNQLPELRLFQAWYYSTPLRAKYRLRTRLQVEERWLRQPDDQWQFRFRSRIQVQVARQIDKSWMLKASEEVMWHITEFDQNRIYVAAEHKWSQRVSIELGYLKIHQKRNKNTRIERNILRGTIYLTL
jgi:Protein of unknown function (DUF2490)